MFIRQAMLGIGAWCLLWGTAVVVLRAVGGLPRLPLVWGALGIVPAVVIAAVLARRRRPTAAAVRAMLDRHNGCGGLLMAADETELGDWRERLAEPALPALRWRGGRAWGLLSVGATFVIVGFALPQRFVTIASSQPLDVSREAGEIQTQISVLEKEKIIASPEARVLEKKLEETTAAASGDDPAKAWESLDHLEEMLQQTAGRGGGEKPWPNRSSSPRRRQRPRPQQAVPSMDEERPQSRHGRDGQTLPGRR